VPGCCVEAQWLQVVASDVEMYGAMIEGGIRIAELITRYAIFESIYLRGEYQAKGQLEQAMLRLYEAILTFLLKAQHYYS
jgi:hypothetical protein